jgi:hypothetical protein
MADAMTDDPTGKPVVDGSMPEIASIRIAGTTATVEGRRGKEKLISTVAKVGDEWLMERWFTAE